MQKACLYLSAALLVPISGTPTYGPLTSTPTLASAHFPPIGTRQSGCNESCSKLGSHVRRISHHNFRFPMKKNHAPMYLHIDSVACTVSRYDVWPLGYALIVFYP